MLRGVLSETGNEMHFDATRFRMNVTVLLRNLVGLHLRMREGFSRLKIGSWVHRCLSLNCAGHSFSCTSKSETPSPECLACPAVQRDHLKANKIPFLLTFVRFSGEFHNIR